MTRRSIASFVAAGVAAALALGAPNAARAQVGYPTDRSPYADLDYKQAFTVLGGYYSGAKDPAGVAPQSGPMVGVQYDLGAGGPALFSVRVRSVISDRTVLDPARDAGRRTLGTEQRPLTFADAGLTLALTGGRTYHGFVPLVRGGVGVVSNFASTDPGGFRFGAKFALDYGLGVRYVPRHSRFSLRADVGNDVFRVRYPNSYATAGLDSTSIVPANVKLTHWLSNTSFTGGISYQFHR